VNSQSAQDADSVLTSVEDRSVKHQALLSSLGVRNSQGSFYTPIDVADKLVKAALGQRLLKVTGTEDCPRVLDPTCGSGNFLVVVALHIAWRLVELGVDEVQALEHAVKNCVFGSDIDPEAVNLCKQSLIALCPSSVKEADLARHVVVRDSLRLFLLGGGTAGQGSLFDEPEESWSDVFPEVFGAGVEAFDAIVGNPPFLSQLQSETVLDPTLASALVNRFGSSLSKMTNPASVFLLGASELVVEGGAVVLIQPVSFLATRESAEIRSLLLRRMDLVEIWVGGPKIFDAAVEVVAVSLVRQKVETTTRITVGRKFEVWGTTQSPTHSDATWSRILAKAKGVPEYDFQSSGVVADVASATADFRDQYYGLVGAVHEQVGDLRPHGEMRLATVGLIDLGVLMWGTRHTRFAKERYLKPLVDTSLLSPALRAWATTRNQPKVVVSNQTRILEPYVDQLGDVLPSVPLLTVDCAREDLWLVAAAVASPVASIVAVERHLGAGMSIDVIKLSAKDLLNLPLPMNRKCWAEGAHMFQRIQDETEPRMRSELIGQFGRIMCDAYATSNDVLEWWLTRLPDRT